MFMKPSLNLYLQNIYSSKIIFGVIKVRACNYIFWMSRDSKCKVKFMFVESQPLSRGRHLVRRVANSFYTIQGKIFVLKKKI